MSTPNIGFTVCGGMEGGVTVECPWCKRVSLLGFQAFGLF